MLDTKPLPWSKEAKFFYNPYNIDSHKLKCVKKLRALGYSNNDIIDKLNLSDYDLMLINKGLQ